MSVNPFLLGHDFFGDIFLFAACRAVDSASDKRRGAEVLAGSVVIYAEKGKDGMGLVTRAYTYDFSSNALGAIGPRAKLQ